MPASQDVEVYLPGSSFMGAYMLCLNNAIFNWYTIMPASVPFVSFSQGHIYAVWLPGVVAVLVVVFMSWNATFLQTSVL